MNLNNGGDVYFMSLGIEKGTWKKLICTLSAVFSQQACNISSLYLCNGRVGSPFRMFSLF